MDLEAMRKAKMTETRLRETFRQTLLRLRRPRERKAALSALEPVSYTHLDVYKRQVEKRTKRSVFLPT